MHAGQRAPQARHGGGMGSGEGNAHLVESLRQSRTTKDPSQDAHVVMGECSADA